MPNRISSLMPAPERWPWVEAWGEAGLGVRCKSAWTGSPYLSQFQGLASREVGGQSRGPGRAGGERLLLLGGAQELLGGGQGGALSLGPRLWGCQTHPSRSGPVRSLTQRVPGPGWT